MTVCGWVHERGEIPKLGNSDFIQSCPCFLLEKEKQSEIQRQRKKRQREPTIILECKQIFSREGKERSLSLLPWNVEGEGERERSRYLSFTMLECFRIQIFANAFIQRHWTMQENDKCRETCLLTLIPTSWFIKGTYQSHIKKWSDFLIPRWVRPFHRFRLTECR